MEKERLKFLLEELKYQRSTARQEAHELIKAEQEGDWRMTSLAKNNLEQANREILRVLEELKKV